MNKSELIARCIHNGQKFNYKSKEYRYVQDNKIYDYSADKLINIEDFDLNLEDSIIQEHDTRFTVVIGMVNDIDNKHIPDVFIQVSNTNSTKSLVIIRQNLYNDHLSNLRNSICIGVGWSNGGDINQNPDNYILDGFIEYYKDTCRGYSFCTYIEDNVESILRCIPPQVKSTVQSALNDIKKYYSDKKMDVDGIASDLKELMEMYQFDERFKEVYNICKFDGIIDKGKYNDDGSIKISTRAHRDLECMLGKGIKNVSVIPYNRDFDLNMEELKTINHFVLYDKSGKIYLIMFDDIN